MAEDPDSDEQLVESLVLGLEKLGIRASSWQSGGGTYVAIVETPNDSSHSEVWGLAAGTWGGYGQSMDGEEMPGTAIVTAIPSSEIASAAAFIKSRLV